MLKTATLTIVIGAVSALFALNADALPLASAKQQAGTVKILTLVRDDYDDEDQPRARVVEEDDDDEGHQVNPLGMILNMSSAADTTTKEPPQQHSSSAKRSINAIRCSNSRAPTARTTSRLR